MVVIIPASAQNSVVERSWNNIIENGDASGEYSDIPCAVSKTDTKDLSPAEIETDGGNKVFAVHAGKKVENAWENQFWIQAPRSFSKHEQVKVSFRYKAATPATITTETHGVPSEYLHWDCIGSINFTDEWQYFSTVIDVQYDGFQSITFDLSSFDDANDYFFDDIEFCEQVVKRPAPGTNLLMNGDASGEYGDIPCAVSKTDTKDLSPAEIETDGGNKVFAVHAGKKVENDWENQFWIQSPIPFAKDEMVKVSFRYKATAPAAIKTETHATPSEYLHWDCIGSVNFTDEWQYFSRILTVPYNGFQSIAFDLSSFDDANDYFFDDLELCEPVVQSSGDFIFSITSEERKTVELVTCTNSVGNVAIPSTVVLDGDTYTVTSIAPYAFEECHELTSIEIPNTVETIGFRAFLGTSLKEVEIPELVTDIAGDLFMGCAALETVKLPNTVTTIGSQAFNSCALLKSIDIPDGVNSIGYGAFYGCSSLESIGIPDGVYHIGYGTFAGCTSLESIVLPSNLSFIEGGTFAGCVMLESVVLPKTMTAIMGGAFSGCTNLKEITSFALTPPICEDNPFDGVDKKECVLCLPVQSIKAYAAAVGWKDFLNVKQIPNKLDLTIKAGWNWISTFLNEPVAVDELFANGAKRVVGQTVESVDDPVFGVVGNLVEIEPGVGYKVYSDAEFTVSWSGVAVDVEEKPVVLRKGWNWIGWPDYVAMEVKTAVGNAEEGDCIVSQDAFANYSGGAWSGTLKVLEPGRGYLYRSVSDKTLQFTFE